MIGREKKKKKKDLSNFAYC